ncbi:MAG TPA: CdaR family protein [Dehalococcoidia bacterium]|nr:CdaR family protein [Dehalococcoidia bacterium]
MPSTVRRLRRRLAGVVFPVLRAIGWVRDVLALAIVSLALSVALWLMITNEQNPPTDRTITVPVELGTAPVNLVAYNSPVGPVNVTVNAPFDIVQRVSIETVTARVDLADAQAGPQLVPVKVQSNDPRVEVVSVEPDRVQVTLVEVVNKQVPVEVELTGNLPPGYVVSGEPQPNPATAMVSGPDRVVQLVDHVVVRDVRLDGARVTINRQVEQLEAVNSLGAPVRDDSLIIEPRAVAVTVPIDQAVAFRTVPVNATITGTVPTGYWLTGINVTPAAVTINGAATAVADVNYVETAPIDVTGVTTRTTRQADVTLPPGVGLTANQAVAVTIDVGVLQGSQTLPVAVQVQNLGPDLTANASPVRVTVAGPVPRLATLLSAEILAVADVAGLDPGESGQASYTRPVTVTVPPELQLVDVTPRFTQVYLQHQRVDTP